MLVTIIADASFDHEICRAGYGFWIASPRGKLKGGGPMREAVQNSTIAEIKALAIALWAAVKHQLVLDGDSVLLQTDCLGAIQMLEQPGGPRSLEVRGVQQVVDNLVEEYKLTIKFKHVRGHTRVQDARSRCNRHCDERARQGLAKARQLFLELQKSA